MERDRSEAVQNFVEMVDRVLSVSAELISV
jgi:hypothetical protein